jgi:hypothetical protein
MAYEWVIPAATEAYDHREELLSAWDRIVSSLLGKKSRIVFTGMPGAGKTVLLDFLSGKGFSQNYSPPLTSQQEEKGRVVAPRKRIQISVVPGQTSRPRLQSLEELFTGRKPVDGIVHVVANGLNEIRGTYTREVLVKDTGLKTIPEFRRHQQAQELLDLDSVCNIIRSSHQRHRKPNWLLVAVAKVDLFHEELDTARAYYSPDAQSQFTQRVLDLQKQIGSDYFRWDAAPVCSWLENFQWNGQTQKSQLSLRQRNGLLRQFSSLLESYCG